MREEDKVYARRVIVAVASVAAICLYGYLAAVYTPTPWLFVVPALVGLVVGLGLEIVRLNI